MKMLLCILCVIVSGCASVHLSKTLPDGTVITADYERWFNQKIDGFEYSQSPLCLLQGHLYVQALPSQALTLAQILAYLHKPSEPYFELLSTENFQFF